MFKGPPKFDIPISPSPSKATSASATASNTSVGTDTKGQPIDLTVRVTDGYRKIGGNWLIVLRACLGSHRPCDRKAGPILKAMMRGRRAPCPARRCLWITPEWPEINLHPPPNGHFGREAPSDCVEANVRFRVRSPKADGQLSAKIGRWAARRQGPRRVETSPRSTMGPGEVKKYAPFVPRAIARSHVGGRRIGDFPPPTPFLRPRTGGTAPQPRRPSSTWRNLMPGPPPQPIALRLLRGNPSKRPIKTGFEPPKPPEPPAPPEFLTSFALDEWRRVAPELHALGVLLFPDVQEQVQQLTPHRDVGARKRLIEDPDAFLDRVAFAKTQSLAHQLADGAPRIERGVGSWNTGWINRRARRSSARDMSAVRRSSNETWPLSGVISPKAMRANVDLPEPLSPIRATISARSMLKLTESTATISAARRRRNRFEMPTTPRGAREAPGHYSSAISRLVRDRRVPAAHTVLDALAAVDRARHLDADFGGAFTTRPKRASPIQSREIGNVAADGVEAAVLIALSLGRTQQADCVAADRKSPQHHPIQLFVPHTSHRCARSRTIPPPNHGL